MAEGAAVFCTRCGGRFVGSDRFCRSCGEPRRAPAPSSTPASAPSRAVLAGAVLQTVAPAASMAAALPWQTVIAGETPDLRAMLASAAVPTARRAVQSSLRKPGLRLAATTALDLAVAALSGGSSAVAAAVPRVLAGALTATLALITGSKGGALRTVTGLVALGTALVQAGSLLFTLIGGLVGGEALLSLVPMGVATASALTMAVKTASVALRRRS
ncbi:MAG: hypothetical protein U1E26_01315 [Coriobacteriia bacterium]|nr:hypothetical protein [Coriobacteriia bacterium]